MFLSPTRIILFFLLSFLCSFASAGMAQAAGINILKVAVQHTEEQYYLVLYTDQSLTHQKYFMLENPLRLVLDIPRVNNSQVMMPDIRHNPLIKNIRFGHFSPQTSRFVLELKQRVKAQEVHHFAASGNQPHRLVVQMATSDTAGTIAEFVPLPMGKPNYSRDTKAKGYRPLIMIDAGHGGKDPGAVGKSNTLEKQITLAYAKTLERAIQRNGRYRSAMTRGDDRFIFLHERVKIARQQDADIFVSLHADSAGEASARGISVYTVSEEASDVEAAKLARQENMADEIGGIDFAEDNPEVANILIDLASRDTRIKATDFAIALVKQFGRQGIKLLKNPNRFAGFRVLKSPDVPSVLIEVGFISNRQDEALLKTAEHREKVARAIIASLDAYFKEHPVR